MSLQDHYSKDAVGLEFVRKRWRVPDRDHTEYPKFLSAIHQLREAKIESLTRKCGERSMAAIEVDSSYIKITSTSSRVKYVIYPEGLSDIDKAMKELFPGRRRDMQVPRRDHHRRVSHFSSTDSLSRS